MADDFVKGLDPLLEELRNLPGNIEKNALRTAIFRAAQELKDEVASAAPVSSGSPAKGGRFAQYVPGTLKAGFKAKRRRGSKGVVAAGVFGIFYAKWVEFGHALKTHGRGGKVIGHVPANPFMARAFEANKEKLVEVARVGVAEAIKKQVDKLRSKMPKV